jgi:predicted nucleic acid-binding protein
LKRFVLDASVALAWLIDPSPAPYALRVQKYLQDGARAVVPALWRLELANGFVMAERRGNVTPTDALEIVENFEIVLTRSIEDSQQPISMKRIIGLAHKFLLTAYDAQYLDTAMTQDLPLATLDRKLEHAAERAGVPLVS